MSLDCFENLTPFVPIQTHGVTHNNRWACDTCAAIQMADNLHSESAGALTLYTKSAEFNHSHFKQQHLISTLRSAVFSPLGSWSVSV